MPRKPRDLEPGVHHVWARGNNKAAIFLDREDRQVYFTLLTEAIRRYALDCLSYCLMGNHVHLLVETTEPNLGRAVQWIHGHYAQTFNQRHHRCNHVFGGRYGSKRMRDDGHLWTTVAYIAVNPVAARLCVRPEEWAWSSHPATVSGDALRWFNRQKLLGYFSGLGGDPLRRYCDAVSARVNELRTADAEAAARLAA